MARLKKGESPFDRIVKIELSMKAWRTKLTRAANTLAKLERDRAYYTRKAVEGGTK